jgi:hypothetical protein
MADDELEEAQKRRIAQYRHRATLVRRTAAGMRSALMREDLMDLAARYDGLADSIESGWPGVEERDLLPR